MSSNLSKIITAVITVLILILLILYSKDIAETVKYCIERCLNTLIPSLFAYMVLCTFLIKSGLSEIITTPLWFILRRFIKLDKKTFSVFILSLIAGYPVGIKMLRELIAQNKNYSEIALHISPVCFASGPAFIIGFAGNVIYDSTIAGLIIFISCTLANTIGAVILTRNNHTAFEEKTKDTTFTGKGITDIIMSSAKAMLMICLSMILFNIAVILMSCLFENSLSQWEIYKYLKAGVEITNISSFDATVSLWLTTFFISFGGLCVIFQLYLISNGEIKLLRFILLRIPLSALSSVICLIITEISGFEAYVPAYLEKKPLLLLHNPLVLISVGAMTIILMILLCESNKKSKKF